MHHRKCFEDDDTTVALDGRKQKHTFMGEDRSMTLPFLPVGTMFVGGLQTERREIIASELGKEDSFENKIFQIGTARVSNKKKLFYVNGPRQSTCISSHRPHEGISLVYATKQNMKSGDKISSRRGVSSK